MDAEAVVEAASLVVDALRPGLARDWSVRAGRLEWDVTSTVAHTAAAVTRYEIHLASRSPRFVELRIDRFDDASKDDLLYALTAVAAALANVAAAAPPGTRAYHSKGMADVTGFVAMACCELLVHGRDAAEGLGLPFAAPDELAAEVAARLFPWAPHGEPGWATLLWATGRGPVAGHPPVADDWAWHCAPLDEWDGSTPRRREPPVAYRLDEQTGRWVAVR